MDPATNGTSPPALPPAYDQLSTVPAGVSAVISLAGRYGLLGVYLGAAVDAGDLDGPDLVHITVAVPHCQCAALVNGIDRCPLHNPSAPSDLIGRVAAAIVESQSWPAPDHRRLGDAGPDVVNAAIAAINVMLRPGAAS